jgi:recombination protein RecR
MTYPKYLEEVISSLELLPGIGHKSAIRMAFQLLDMSDGNLEKMGESLKALPQAKTFCERCHSLSTENICPICNDSSRDHSLICVVSNYKDVYSIEKMNTFNGVYHVLGGDIRINKGIMPQDLNIASLLERINENTIEVIIATTPSIEGETTALYLNKELKIYPIKITRIGYGVPMGIQLDYLDGLTMNKAFENRKEVQDMED